MKKTMMMQRIRRKEEEDKGGEEPKEERGNEGEVRANGPFPWLARPRYFRGRPVPPGEEGRPAAGRGACSTGGRRTSSGATLSTPRFRCLTTPEKKKRAGTGDLLPCRRALPVWCRSSSWLLR